MTYLSFFVAYFIQSFSYQGHIPIDEINCMAKAVYHESRGEPINGQIAVSYVILNRMDKPKYSNVACEVVYQPAQFTDLYPHNYVDYNSLAWRRAVAVAVFTYTGKIEDPTKGATLFYNPRKVRRVPKWKALKTVQIKNHIFLREYA